MSMHRILLRAAPDPGGDRVVIFESRQSVREISQLITGGGALDTVCIRRRVDLQLAIRVGGGSSPEWDAARITIPPGFVMLVDDTGLVDGKPINSLASQVYAAQCRPGTNAVIAGDAFICPDEDFA